MTGRSIAISIVVLASLAPSSSAEQPANAVEVVSVVGCVSEQSAGTWILANATDPVKSIANGPPATEVYKGPLTGKNSFRLIGVNDFPITTMKGQIVLVKALLIKAAPVSRLNVTSVTRVAESCSTAK